METERLNKEKELIRRIRAFNMGWFGLPKNKWRGFGLYVIVVGLLFLILFPLTEELILISKQFGLILIIFGAIINSLNG